ncbi:MAG: hypothetical protein AAGI28_12960 [Pseudomonadota bacterium]
MRIEFLTAAMCLVSSVFSAAPAFSDWKAATGKVDVMNMYDHTSTVLVALDTQPTGPVAPGCLISSFAIDGALPADRRQQLISLLVSAKLADRAVTIAWDDLGSCVPYFSSQYARIVRITLD